MDKYREKKHRLDLGLYKSRVIVAYTVCIVNNGRGFVSEEVFGDLEKILYVSMDKNGCIAHVYVFMPDHGHLLLEGISDSSDTWRCMVDFKQRSGYWFSRNKFQFKWQKDFYDHILRKDEDVVKQVRYILENPVRKKLVDCWREYPFKGSTVYNLDEVDW